MLNPPFLQHPLFPHVFSALSGPCSTNWSEVHQLSSDAPASHRSEADRIERRKSWPGTRLTWLVMQSTSDPCGDENIFVVMLCLYSLNLVLISKLRICFPSHHPMLREFLQFILIKRLWSFKGKWREMNLQALELCRLHSTGKQADWVLFSRPFYKFDCIALHTRLQLLICHKLHTAL